MSKSGIDRRTFIAVGTAAIAGLATTGLQAESLAGDVVSVGFRPFITRGRLTGSDRGALLLEASSLSVTEPSLMRTGARLTVRGASTRSRIAVDVIHHADNVDDKVVFHAWRTGSNGLSFEVPVELERTLDIAVNVGGKRKVFPMAVGAAQGALKLNTGKYIFAVGDRAPAWSTLRMENDTLTNFDGTPVGFDYVVVSVDTPSLAS